MPTEPIKTRKPTPAQLLRATPTHARLKGAFIIAGFISLCLSVGLWAAGNETEAIFVGLWVPSLHSLGALILAGEHHGR